MNSHDAIQDLKRVAADLGRVPTRDEYKSIGHFTRDQYEHLFSSWTAFIIAAGLKPHRNKAFKITAQDVFGADIRETIKPFEPKQDIEIKAPKPAGHATRILAIGDTHFPFVSQATLNAIYSFIEALPEDGKPEAIVQVGDLYDMYSHAKFPRSRNIYNPREEIELGHEMAAKMWETLRKLALEAQCHQILGNHDARPLKRVIEQYPEGEVFFSMDKWFQFPGVTTHMDPRVPLDLGSAVIIHGHRSRSIDHWLDLPGKNIIHGHTHKGQVSYRRHGSVTNWILDVGFTGEPESKVFGYMPLKILNMLQGLGWVDQHGPRLIAV